MTQRSKAKVEITRKHVSKPRRQPQRERGKTRGKTNEREEQCMALHVHYNFFFIFLSRPLQNNNVTNGNHYILRILDNASPDGKYFMFLLENDACLYIFSLNDHFDSVRQAEYIQQIREICKRNTSSFFSRRFPRRRCLAVNLHILKLMPWFNRF